MKNLIGYLKKILYLFSLPFILLLFSNVQANENFIIHTTFEHSILENTVQTDAILQIKSESAKVLSYYTASIPVKDILPECSNFKTGQKLDCTYYHRGTITDVLIDLKNSVLKPDNPLEILIRYTTEMNTTNSYTISSKVIDTTTTSVLIRYPKGMGEPLWSSDPIQNIKTSGENLEVTIINPVYDSTSLLFGESIMYKFEISKVFSNTLKDENQTFEIYVPSDTFTQLIIWDNISPLPNTALQDEDGNFVFKYILAPEQTLDCRISGYILKTENKQEEESKSFLIQKSGYWSITNSTEFKRVNTYLQKKDLKIQNDFDDVNSLENTQKELFYKYIYQYVLERLNYDKDISLGITNETRLGANAITEASNNCSAIDYADFLIGLLRSYKVPSRMIVGYISNITGYTADGFYHHWVEYYDSTSKQWITVDPFLEEYFEKPLFGSIFYDHISILKRGKSAVAPKLSFFTENDFTIRSESNNDIKAVFDISSQLDFEDFKITDRYLKGYIYISNTGNTTFGGYSIGESSIKDIKKYIDPVNNLQSQIILPKQNASLQLNIPYEKLNSKNIELDITYENINSLKKDSTLQNDIEEKIPFYLLFLGKFLSLVVFSGITFLIYFLVRKFKQRKNG